MDVAAGAGADARRTINGASASGLATGDPIARVKLRLCFNGRIDQVSRRWGPAGQGAVGCGKAIGSTGRRGSVLALVGRKTRARDRARRGGGDGIGSSS